MAKLEVYGNLEVQDEIVFPGAAYISGSIDGSGTLTMKLELDGGTPLLTIPGKIRANTVFNVNGTDGITTTFVDNDGNTITVTGGIITAKTAP